MPIVREYVTRDVNEWIHNREKSSGTKRTPLTFAEVVNTKIKDRKYCASCDGVEEWTDPDDYICDRCQESQTCEE